MKRGAGGRVWLAAALLLAGTLGVAGGEETWRGLVVAPEDRCSPYDRARDYPYPPSVEADIARRLGAVVGPYTGTCFGSTADTDIEHIVATSEAHDSGLCARDRATRARFASDLLNLTLAAPHLNRHQKKGKDAAEWLPARNRCWFATTVVAVRRAYQLTIDRREADALEGILSRCHNTDMEPAVCSTTPDSGGRREPAAYRRRRARPLRRQRQWPDHLQGGETARDRAGEQGSSGVSVYAGRRRRRGGV